MHITIFSENPEIVMEIATKTREVMPKDAMISAITTRQEDMGIYGVNKLHLIKKLGSIEEAYTLITRVIDQNNSNIIILESNKNNKEIAVKIASKYKAGYISECIDYMLDNDGKIIAKRMVYASKAIENIKVLSEKAVLTIPKGVIKPQAKWNLKCETIIEEIERIKPKIEIVEVKRKELGAVPLESAEVIVSAGRGLRRKEDCKILEDLANILGGVVSCSRPVAADLKWFNEWVGLSGHKVKPKLYVAVGISGAIQHLAGIQGAKIVIAINKDSEAPIMKSSDYGVAGDLYEIIPKLIEKLRLMVKK